MPGSLRRDADRRLYGKPAMQPERARPTWPRLVKLLLYVDVYARLFFSIYVWMSQWSDLCITTTGPVPNNKSAACDDEIGHDVLFLVVLEMYLSMWLFYRWARWETDGHLTVAWSTLGAFMTYVVRHAILQKPIVYLLVLFALIGMQMISIFTEFYQITPLRLPPFCAKKEDVDAPKYGALGEWMAQNFRTKFSRVFITLWIQFFYAFLPFPIMLYVLLWDDIGPGQNILGLLYVSIFLVLIMAVMFVWIYYLTFVGLGEQCLLRKDAPLAYKTGAYEVCDLDECDLTGETKRKYEETLAKHDCRACTVVLPAYLPNEAEICMDVLAWYREKEPEYPGELRVMFVYNTPMDMPDIEKQLQELTQEWPALSVHRCHNSTSKCDNLNLAISLLETDMALLNDTDTICSVDTIKRASLRIFEEGYDIVQAVNIHCEEDWLGRPDGSAFCMGQLITAEDSVVDWIKRVQNNIKRVPFNGRGGFWHTDALRCVGFDYRIVSEDHDAAYRLFAYFGGKGMLDINMLCQEREPPSCRELTKQRIRWEGGGMALRRTYSWMLRSDHYRLYDLFVVYCLQARNWVQPWHSMPGTAMAVLLLLVGKAFILYLFRSHEVAKVYISGIGIPLIIIVLLLIITIVSLITLLPIFFFRLMLTRYTPKWFYLAYVIICRPTIITCYFFYIYLCAVHDFFWGTAAFICTARSAAASMKAKENKGALDPEAAEAEKEAGGKPAVDEANPMNSEMAVPLLTDALSAAARALP